MPGTQYHTTWVKIVVVVNGVARKGVSIKDFLYSPTYQVACVRTSFDEALLTDYHLLVCNWPTNITGTAIHNNGFHQGKSH